MKPTLVFDYDGTIHNTILLYETAFRQCHDWLVREGYAEKQDISTEQISGWLGMNMWDMWNSFLPELPDAVKEAAGRRIGDAMLTQIRQHQARWYEGAEEVLEQLRARGYPMLVLSNCKSIYRQANWEEFSMHRWFTAFYDCESYGFRPKTEIIKEIGKRFAPPYILIGDRRSDLDCARACGSPFVGCLYGYGEAGELDGADLLAESVRELPALVGRIKLKATIQ